MATATATQVPAPTPLSAEELFDAVGPAYETAFAQLDSQQTSVIWLLDQLSRPERTIFPAKIVDIGCGTGRPVCSMLADHGHDVLGIDISGAMIDAARERVPKAKFEKLDFRDFSPPNESYDAVTVYFSLIAGVTQEEIRGFWKKVFGILKPGGLIVWSTVPLDAEEMQISWMGRPTVVSSLAPDAAVEAVKAAGFEVLEERSSVFLPQGAEAGLCKKDDVWEEPHLFVYARKP